MPSTPTFPESEGLGFEGSFESEGMLESVCEVPDLSLPAGVKDF